ncbi:MAG: TetR family transcriptional regulator [Marmoricola sp.]|nr:TetR family transcriptional regulator [Marmoricola sp.]
MEDVSPNHDDRLEQLAESALTTLGELGYARASFHEIASNADFSDDDVHSYFDDKIELVVYCVRYYKAKCVHRYDGVVIGAMTPEELIEGFAAKLGETIREDAPMHRLWYDLRSQSMFEPRLREVVTMIDRTLEKMVWRVLDRYAELVGKPLIAANSSAVYGMLDGLFQQTLLIYADGGEPMIEALADEVRELLPILVRAG